VVVDADRRGTNLQIRHNRCRRETGHGQAARARSWPQWLHWLRVGGGAIGNPADGERGDKRQHNRDGEQQPPVNGRA
jgi:hypothetical protein